MADATWTTTTRINDALILIDDSPTWVLVSAVQAVQPALTSMRRTVIYLAGGGEISTSTPVEDVIEKMAKAMKPDG